MNLAESSAPGGGLVVKSVSGNAAKAGISAGDTVIYTSSFFGDELWPSDRLSFTNSAVKAAPRCADVSMQRCHGSPGTMSSTLPDIW